MKKREQYVEAQRKREYGRREEGLYAELRAQPSKPPVVRKKVLLRSQSLEEEPYDMRASHQLEPPYAQKGHQRGMKELEELEVKGATESRGEPVPSEQQVEPGDWVYVRVFKKSYSPTYPAPSSSADQQDLVQSSTTSPSPTTPAPPVAPRLIPWSPDKSEPPATPVRVRNEEPIPSSAAAPASSVPVTRSRLCELMESVSSPTTEDSEDDYYPPAPAPPRPPRPQPPIMPTVITAPQVQPVPLQPRPEPPSRDDSPPGPNVINPV
ncbi:hypothetical protein GBF38_012796 [Nibea albiflora]|uniref:Uncharacterized protein n=1 Tax=Nibea albiflora TaxID=240163 RepID=A0ACB7EJW4_NIBAL|nr:hypothetical protein GBF38_012796 [Nibea albiflora]